MLDETPDTRLLGREAKISSEMANGVRALLYLWNGWADECSQSSETVPEAHGAYIQALCDRHRGNTGDTKLCFNMVGPHPIFPLLAEYALSVINPDVHHGLVRMHDTVAQNRAWEPFLFTDTIGLAKAGKLEIASEETVRRLQCREFELLLAFFYEEATGEKLKGKAPRQDEEREQRLREIERKRRREQDERKKKIERERQRQADDALKPKKPDPKKDKVDSNKPTKVRLRCPKCEELLEFAPEARGKRAKCGKCSVVFTVPAGGGQPGSSAGGGARGAASSQVVMLCPKCATRLTLPAEARGKRGKCNKCNTAFQVPTAKPSAAAR
jgi:ribosomal protein S27AE